jgi:hypothetical protein
MGKVSSVVDTVLGEALAGDYNDMVAVASTIANRATQTGVSYQSVVSAPGQFDAYGKSLPPGVGKYRDMAKQAIAEVRSKGPVHAATFYATPAAVKGLPKGLAFETKTAGHQYYSDPKGRAIATAQGYKTPDPSVVSMASYAPTPAVGPTPQSKPAVSAIEALLGITDPATQARGAFSFKTDAAKKGVENFAPDMAKSFANISRGLADPSSYTVTSTAEARPGLADLTHVRDQAAMDVRTRGLDQKALDDLAVAAMYDKGVKSIGWNDTRFDPHAHIGTTASYYSGLGRRSDISGLSPAVQDAMRSWSESVRSGTPFAPMVPEAIAPTPFSGRAPVTPVSRSPLSPIAGVATAPAAPNRGFAGPAVSFSQPGLTTNIDQANMTAPAMTGPAPRSVTTQSFSPAQRGRADPTQAQMAALSRGLQEQAKGIVEARAEPAPTRGRVDPTAAQMADLSRGLQEQALSLQEAPRSASFSVSQPSAAPSARSVTEAVTAMTPDIGMPTQGPSFGPQRSAVAAKEEGILDGLEQAAAQEAAAQQAASQQASQQAAAQQAAVSAPSVAAVSAPSVGPATTQAVGPSLGPGGALGGLLGGVGNVAKSVVDGVVGTAQQAGKGVKGTMGKSGMRGAAIGATVGGIPGGVLGALLGMAMSRSRSGAPAGLWSGGKMTRAEALSTFARGYTPGLGFPENPGGPGQGGLTAKGEAASRGDFGGQAQTAADNPGKGLY